MEGGGMIKRNLATVIICAGFFWVAFMPVSEARDDWQYWNNFELKAGLGEQYFLKVEGEQRLRDDFSDFFFANVDAGLGWKMSKYLDVGLYYKFEHEKKASGRKSSENRYHVDVNLKWRRGAFSLVNRNRLEYRDFNISPDGWRYRNRLTLGWDFHVRSMVLTPYIAEEFFADTVSRQWSQNRVAFGVKTRLNEALAVKIYYLLKSTRAGSSWNETQVLGTGLSLYV